MASPLVAPATPTRSSSASLRTTPAFSPRSPAAAGSSDSPSRPSSAIIYGVQGAEGGVQAITARRRNSGSFKHMATGGLVSKSPFTQRTGPASPVKTSPASSIPVSNGLYRRTSGSRRASGETEGPVKENSNPSDLNELANGPSPADSYKSPNSKTRAFFSGSPFRPVTQSQDSPATLSTRGTPSSSPFRPARPTSTHIREDSHDGSESPRRQTSSFAALRKNNLVSSSPFAASEKSIAPSPELPQVPYEIGALTLESAPMEFHRPSEEEYATSPSSPRPKEAETSDPADHPETSLLDRYNHALAEPVKSSLAGSRRGMRGPRPLDGSAAPADDGDETEREDLPRVVRRQPSSKSVAWAETEEVFEFEVESERRQSLMSETSTDDGRYYNSSSDDEQGSVASEDHVYPQESVAKEDHAYPHPAEGGFSWSVPPPQEPVHAEAAEDADEEGHNSDAEESVVSTASSAMDEIVGQIDEYLHEESYEDTAVFSPSQIPSFDDQPDLPSHHGAPGYSSPRPPQGPRSAFSNSTVSASDDTASDAVSTSSYGNESDEEAQSQVARKVSVPASSAPPMSLPPLPSQTELPTKPADEAPAVTSHAAAQLPQSDSQFSLPDIPGTSPFLGFEDDGTAESVVTLGTETKPLALGPVKPLQPQSSAPMAAPPIIMPQRPLSRFEPRPITSSVDRMAERGLASPINLEASPALSRKASLVGSEVTTSSISWYGSTASGSLRGGTVRLGRDRLEERMKAHQALFGPNVGSPAPSFGGVPTPASPTGSSSTEASRSTAPTSVGDHADLKISTATVANRAIEARPAPKARSATLSSSMLPTIAASPQRSGLDLNIGSPLTAKVAEEMQSPLERLQRGMQVREGSRGWSSGDSLLGHAQSATEASTDDLASLSSEVQRPRGGRRRSRSTGDADLAETASITTLDAQPAMPQLGFEPTSASEGFGSSVLQSLDDIYNSRNRSYRVHESKRVVVVSDINGSKAGDVDPGKAWRRKRPSDVVSPPVLFVRVAARDSDYLLPPQHAINRSLSTMSVSAPSARKAKEMSGQLFLLCEFSGPSHRGVPLRFRLIKSIPQCETSLSMECRFLGSR